MPRASRRQGSRCPECGRQTALRHTGAVEPQMGVGLRPLARSLARPPGGCSAGSALSLRAPSSAPLLPPCFAALPRPQVQEEEMPGYAWVLWPNGSAARCGRAPCAHAQSLSLLVSPRCTQCAELSRGRERCQVQQRSQLCRCRVAAYPARVSMCLPPPIRPASPVPLPTPSSRSLRYKVGADETFDLAVGPPPPPLPKSVVTVDNVKVGMDVRVRPRTCRKPAALPRSRSSDSTSVALAGSLLLLRCTCTLFHGVVAPWYCSLVRNVVCGCSFSARREGAIGSGATKTEAPAAWVGGRCHALHHSPTIALIPHQLVPTTPPCSLLMRACQTLQGAWSASTSMSSGPSSAGKAGKAPIIASARLPNLHLLRTARLNLARLHAPLAFAVQLEVSE